MYAHEISRIPKFRKVITLDVPMGAGEASVPCPLRSLIQKALVGILLGQLVVEAMIGSSLWS